MPRLHRTVAAAAAATAIALMAGACTGQSSGSAEDDPTKDVTITFWHGWSAKSEVKGIEDNIKAFEKTHPNIKVKVVGNVNDDKIKQALRAGGAGAPDVVSSFTTVNVGSFCSSNVLADLKPFLEKSKIDPEKTFPKPLLEYTQYEGERCALPLLSDTFGLYYNKDAFRKAGIKAPPKTMSEFKKVAKKLTKSKGDSYEQLGFMPNWHGYETAVGTLGAQWGAKYFDSSGKSSAASDPGLTAMFEWQKDMVDELGGYKKLEKYRSTFGDEWGAKNPFHTGQVAMSIDGEWRGGMIKDAGVDFNFGVAPFPVPDDQVDSYGKGYLSGTIIGIANTSKKQNAAWELVKYLTTDTDAVVNFSNAIHNVPSTFEALQSPKLQAEPWFQTFIAIAQHPQSSSAPASPNGGAYLLTLQDVGYGYESGKIKDLKAALEKADKQIDTDLAHAK